MEIRVISQHAKKDVYQIVIIRNENGIKTSETRHVSGNELNNLKTTHRSE